MKAARLALIALACAAPVLASAQWMYLDRDGHKVFSDQAPPADTPANKILRRPGMRAGEAAAQPVAATAPATPKASGKDASLEEKRKQLEAAEAAKKKADDEKVASAKFDNCTRAQAAKKQLDSGARIARPNSQGEREFMDDAQRAAEARRLEGIIAKDCAP